MSGPKDNRSPSRTQRPGLWVVPEQRRRPSPRPVGARVCDDPTVRVHGIIYAWLVYEIDPRTGRLLPPDPATGERRTRLDYVGQTIRTLDVRSEEHLEDKPWADIVVSDRPIVVEEGEWTKDERDAKEIAAIHRIRPRYNYRDNLDNPERIEIFRQIDQRHNRDRAAGRQPWLPVHQRSVAAQVAAEKALVQAGLDGYEPRYPLELAGAALGAIGRFLIRLPRWLQLALVTPLVLAGAIWGSSTWLMSVGWPSLYAQAGAIALWLVLAIAVLRHKRVRRWARRKRR